MTDESKAKTKTAASKAKSTASKTATTKKATGTTKRASTTTKKTAGTASKASTTQSTVKKSAVKKTTAKKATAKKPAAKATTAKKSTASSTTKKAAAKPAATAAKKASAKKAPAKAASATKAATSKATAKKPAAKAAATSKAKTASKSPAKQTTAKAGSSKTTTPKKAAATKKPAAKKATTKPASKTAPKKTASKKATPKKAGSTQSELALQEPSSTAVAPEKTVSGATVSYSHVQEPPEHLTKRVAKDHVVAFHYALREVRPDGSVSHWLESSFGRQPLLYLHGHGNVVPGLEAGLDGKKAGDQLSVTLSPEQAYGLRTSNEVLRVPIKHLAQAPAAKNLKPGVIVGVKTNKGVRNMLVLKVGKFNVDVDTNHPYAGRTLEYQIEVLGVRSATEREIQQRRPGAR